ncbi:MAG TPA: bifunctional hydroxymethylpyrimidine kinase/phosphomethylpyrimidine kinase [Candidatus Blautia stercoravium]|nr:bifunctional hydroxymethylpyrimidine kinase/phosphomethylpyrimidine kinase [Candidatus Blautia stercoravium]
MKCKKEDMQLYAVTDRTWVGEKTFKEQVEESLEGGITFLQLREKHLAEEEFFKEAVEIRQLAAKYKVPFVINDNVEIARKAQADGVHIGQKDMGIREARKILGPDKIIGVSCRTVEDAKKAEALGADYLGVGAVFGTSTKKDAKPITREELRTICRAVSIPVVAIGGVKESNLKELKGSGVSGVAVISGIYGQKNIKEACRRLRELSEEMTGRSMKKVLSIAGSDSSGGAGIQADIKTIAAHGLYAMTAITALTAQNTTGVYGIQSVPPEFVAKQLDCVFQDICPDAVKIGMVSDSQIIHAIAEKLRGYEAKNIVVDPVMSATSGGTLMQKEAEKAIKAELFPLADVVTPNLLEAEILTGMNIKTEENMEKAAQIIGNGIKGAVLLKGGHLNDRADDLLYIDGKFIWYSGEKVENPNTHGTGCTLSSAIACNLAAGFDVPESVRRAKAYITGALWEQLNLGKGSGPLDHMYVLRRERQEENY